MLYSLHYLHEQEGTGQKRFVYSCTDCSCILSVSRDLGSTNEVRDSIGRCIGCGRLLEDNVECQLAPVSDELSRIFSSPPPPIVESKATFRLASSLPHFSLGFPRLDSLLRPLSEGRLIVLDGSVSSVIAELAAFRAQLPIEAGGLDSATLFIDGGNKSDPYLFSSFARQKRQKPTSAMRRIATCRVFTFYQLADLISGHLERAIDDHGTKLVVISDLLGTFNEPEIDEREARRLLKGIEEGIARAKKNALVVTTLAAPNKYDEMVAEWADVHVRLSASKSSVQAELVKHRNRLPTTSTFKLSQLLGSAKRGA
jgi:Rad51